MARRLDFLRAFAESPWVINVDSARRAEREAAVALVLTRDASIRAEIRFIMAQALWSQGPRRADACREVAAVLKDTSAEAVNDAARTLAKACPK
ncbi:MAG: hypothetical protein IPK85_05225 [Gemmatimonadetes bacterium]|nr:hypothetical protein [Gemmatimonadota bacterium]